MITIRDEGKREIAVVLGIADYTGHKEKRFYSEAEESIQVGSLYFATGETVKPHLHKAKTITEVKPVEVILVLSGFVVAHIYGDDDQKIDSIGLRTGDILIQKRGGHGFEFDSGVGTRILEVKCGPYYGRDSDKEDIV